MSSHWIEDIGMKKGALHKQLGVPTSQPIPAGKLHAAANSSNPLEAKRARLAETLKGMKK